MIHLIATYEKYDKDKQEEVLNGTFSIEITANNAAEAAIALSSHSDDVGSAGIVTYIDDFVLWRDDQDKYTDEELTETGEVDLVEGKYIITTSEMQEYLDAYDQLVEEN